MCINKIIDIKFEIDRFEKIPVEIVRENDTIQSFDCSWGFSVLHEQKKRRKHGLIVYHAFLKIWEVCPNEFGEADQKEILASFLKELDKTNFLHK